MFDQITFDISKTKEPMTPQIMNASLSTSELSLRNQSIQFDIDDNDIQSIRLMSSSMQELDFYINGKLESFRCPPISKYAKENLFYLIGFTVFHVDSHFFTRRAYYPLYFILYTYQGYGLLEYEGKTYHLGEGDGFFIDARKPHHYKCTKDQWVHGIIDITGPTIEELYHHYISNGSPVFTQPINGSLQNGLEKLLSIYSTGQPYRDWQASACINSILTDLLVSSLEDSNRNITLPKNMQYLIHYMENNYTQSINIEYLSSFSGISRSHLTREFKKYTGYAPNEYLIQLRLEAAKKLLGSTSFPAAKIAFMVGFHNVNNFVNLFKKNVGMTPGAYRQRIFQI